MIVISMFGNDLHIKGNKSKAIANIEDMDSTVEIMGKLQRKFIPVQM